MLKPEGRGRATQCDKAILQSLQTNTNLIESFFLYKPNDIDQGFKKLSWLFYQDLVQGNVK